MCQASFHVSSETNLPAIDAQTRERQEQERKFREQIDTLSVRVAELDTENRKLRDSKYDLDSKVRRMLGKMTMHDLIHLIERFTDILFHVT